MAIHLYVVPITHLPGLNVPKYFPSVPFNPPILGLENVRWAWTTYLLEDVGLLVAEVSTAQHTLLTSQTDILVIPALDTTISNTTIRNTVRAKLESVNIPGNWINTGMTYRSILRIVLGLFFYHNRLVYLLQKRIFDGSVNLDLTVNQIPIATRNRLKDAADNLGLDYSAVTGSTTIRELLRGIGSQFASQQLVIAGAGIQVII